MKSLERQLISAELKQRSEEGCDVKEISERVKFSLADKGSDQEIFDLYEELISLPVDDSFPYIQPLSYTHLTLPTSDLV